MVDYLVDSKAGLLEPGMVEKMVEKMVEMLERKMADL